MVTIRTPLPVRIAVPLLAALLIHPAAPLEAQSPTAGAITGRVLDDRGIAVPDATVTLMRDGSNLALVEADPEGLFTIDDIRPGEYVLLVEQLGFQPVRYHGIRVVAGERLSAGFEIPRRPPPITTVLDRWIGAAGPAEAGTVIDGEALGRLDHRRDALDLSRDLSAVSRGGQGLDAGFLAANGLPASESRLVVDGIEQLLLRHPGFPGEVASAPSFARDGIDQARFSRFRLDAGLPAASGALVELTTTSRARRTTIRPWLDWSGATLAAAAADNPADSSGNSIEGGFSASGPIGRDSSSWAIRADYRRLALPSPDPFTTAGVAEAIAAARPSLDAAAWTAPAVRTWEGFTGSGQVAFRPSSTSRVTARVSGASWTEDNPLVTSTLANGAGSALDAKDLSAAVTAEFWGEEYRSVTRIGLQHSSRDWTGPSLPGAILTSEGAAIGGDATLPGEFRTTTFDLHETLLMPSGDHLISVGAGVSLRKLRYDWLVDGAGQATFGSLDDFGAGSGTWVSAAASNAAPDLSVPEVSIFAQDAWQVTPKVRFDVGIRFQAEFLPQNAVTVNPAVANAFGLFSSVVPRNRSSGVGPRLGVRWDPSGRGRTVVHLASALVPGRHDLAALAEAARYDGSVTVTRASGTIGWPAAPDPADAVTGTAVTFYGTQVRAPRTFVLAGGISHALAPGTILSVSGGFDHTDYLLRRDDINRPTSPFAHTADGMAIWGELEQFGALIAPVPGSNRRVGGFDHVWGLTSTGYAEQRYATVTLERHASSGLGVVASYTWSRTDDNMVGRLSANPANRVVATDPTGDVTGGWSDGRSDLDVPHRVVIRANYDSPGNGALHLGARWRWRSGLPFTPGYAPGVDVNGDGASTNDPVGLGSVGGVAALLGGAGCDVGSGGLAARNSCRSKAVQAIDLEAGVRLPVGGDRLVMLTVDAFNLAASAIGYVDRAAVLVDPSGAITTDASGNMVLPLVLNDHFGQLLSRRTAPRTIRFGLRVEN